MAIEILESNLNPSKKQIRFINVVVDLQDRLGTGEISVVTFNNEYSLHFTANSMLVNAAAGFNIERIVKKRSYEKLNHNINLIPQERNCRDISITKSYNY